LVHRSSIDTKLGRVHSGPSRKKKAQWFMSTVSSFALAKSDSDTRRMTEGRLSDLSLMRIFSISLPMVTKSWGSTKKLACCDWKKVMTSSRARAASSWDGVIGDDSAEDPLSSSIGPDVAMGTGGGCIEFVTGVGDRDSDSSITGKPIGISAMGESSVPLLMYFGVRASEELGGDMNCSTPTSIGNVWLRGLWKLPLPG